MTAYPAEFIDILDHNCGFDLDKLSDQVIDDIYNHCKESIEEYIEEDDTMSRESLMEDIGLFLTGIAWPRDNTSKDQKDKFKERIYNYLKTPDEFF